ncbi:MULTISPECIES: phosphoribosylglycinamide formyltransferase [Tatumella]|uniref:Phosphoribosylglycinamide formyltransferase n=1 Tax=Tatumella punctata TaxID=399969 RepID=A0ABW1VQS0_9GAMM|nr:MULTISPECIES: phosphoribosylglycinamide formyltransferase [unclassified Tatumella]MBS0857321.1 phosphoribosylglycinamide formyltransferase [Tatumella sp. JGM16]MBS0878665.1 phosphoribosylglycinamide formyltransferase [Tatumella sp. JGM82]MBS0892159.1 phosphoribosylglycinamide formyltransferase [Tatumella sp. JGM94]MBS0903258.1 phosphoribosylglycinamide formyltransferase [Tatumella sp. JGM100]MBS0914074.1 phosphoribosylglycinamide formyltransferase [Tatumella sp. JGM91]
MKRLVILISGTGTNLQAIIDACRSGQLAEAAEIVAVFSNKVTASGLDRARQAGIPAHALTPSDFADRQQFDRQLMKLVDEYSPDLVVLAGYMRILSAEFVQHYAGHMINIHPSLLPAYPGLHTHRQVLENGDKQHGVSVHFVTEQLDGGPVILQAVVPVNNGDTEQQLQDKIRVQEHVIYPQAIQWFLENRLRLKDGLAWLDGTPLPATGIRSPLSE